MMLTKLGQRIFHTAVLLTTLALPSTTGCGSKPAARPVLPISIVTSHDESIVCGNRPPIVKRDREIQLDTSSLSPNFPKDGLVKIKSLVGELNQYIPDHPIRTIIPESTCRGGDNLSGATIAIEDASLETTAHEVGHSVYLDYGDRDRGIGSIWIKIFNVSFGHKNYNLVMDESYFDPLIIKERRAICGNDWHAGHPWDNDSELFASSFMVYRLHPDEFLARILNPAASSENREFGKLLYVFFRNWVFHGKTFSKTDPFKDLSLCQLLKDNRLDAMQKKAEDSLPVEYSRCDNHWIRRALYWRILQTTKDFKIFVNTIIQGIFDPYANNRHDAYMDISIVSNDVSGRSTTRIGERFHISLSEASRIIKESNLSKLLIKALENEISMGNTENGYRVINALEDLGDPSIVPQLQRHVDDSPLGKYIKKAVDKLSTK